MNRFEFMPLDDYNLDETGLTTVHRPTKMLPAKAQRQVGQVILAKRGVLLRLTSTVLLLEKQFHNS